MLAMRRKFSWLAALVFSLIVGRLTAAQTPVNPGPAKEPLSGLSTVWAEFVEKDFPFYSSVLDDRRPTGSWPTNNLTPRGLILNLGHGCWACFDIDLLRVSAIWTGSGVSPVGMAPGSYHVAGRKAPEGQSRLPQIDGLPWLVNGIYPGWQPGAQLSVLDPRTPAPSPGEVGRGPIDVALGRFKAVRLTQDGVCLEYEVSGVPVREWIEARSEGGNPTVQRHFQLERVPGPLTLALGQLSTNNSVSAVLKVDPAGVERVVELATAAHGVRVVHIQAAQGPIEFRVAFERSGAVEPQRSSGKSIEPPSARWPETVVTSAVLAQSQSAYVIDNVSLPLANPWRRNVRLADMAFFKDGRAAAVSFDGDVWLITGLTGDLHAVRWKRFTSGLHEPLALAVRDDELFVFDRNGIWRLRDTDLNGEADVHELFSNAFAQTAETREFATGLRLAPDGAFILSKGGQQSSTIGVHNGTVLRVSPDGKSASVLGWGLRMPFIGVHPGTGLITASDQQGHYVPSTALHIIRDRRYHGFVPTILPKEQYPAKISEPLTWIPHPVNASAASQVWLLDAKLGPLSGRLINIGYYRPELLLVLLNEREPEPQAAVVSLTRDFSFAPLNGAINPATGEFFVIGFQIWGTEASQISGLARLRYTGAPSTFPREVVPMDQGVLLRFDVPLEADAATSAANYSAERWMYQRTANYGSPHFRLDGTPGRESMIPSSAYLSKDGRSVFLGVPDMKPVQQMRVGWTLPTQAGVASEHNAYFTVHALSRFDPEREGFEPISVDLTPKEATLAAHTPLTVEEGQRLATLMACVSCHSSDGTILGKVGPSWKGLFGSEVALTNGRKVVANETYIRESILEPNTHIVRGFDKSDTGMPSYQGVLTDTQIEALILYIKSLH